MTSDRESVGPLRDDYFQPMYRAGADPYGVRDRWYEQRKRDLLLASLPHRRFARAFEPACGIGETTFALAMRCDRLLACDFSAYAVESARERMAPFPHVRVDCLDVTGAWPAEAAGLDLIVLGEVGYFLDPAHWPGLADRCVDALTPGGVLAACHWRPDFDRRTGSSESLHDRLGRGLHTIVSHMEDDFVLHVWSNDKRSVAQLEGIR